MQAPWLASYPSEVDPNPALDERTLADLIRAGARFAAAEAFRALGVSLTYGEVLEHANAVTAWLQQQGVRRGDRVAIMLPNLLSYPVILYGALLGGHAVVNVNPLYTSRELTHQLNDSGARVLFVLEPFAHIVAQALPQVSLDKVVVVAIGDFLGARRGLVNFVARRIKKAVPAWRLQRHITLRAALAAGRRTEPAPVDIAPDDVAFIQYTGGTTGVSKGAVILHRNAMAMGAALEAWNQPFVGLPDGERHRMILPLPMYHAAALHGGALFWLRVGGCCVLVPNPRDLDGYVKLLAKERFTLMAGVNTLYNALLNHPRINRVDFSRCRLFFSGAAATQRTVAERWHTLTGKPIVEAYGMSETTVIATVNRLDADAFTGSVGLPIPLTEVSIRDDSGKELAIGETGEVCIRGPQVMAGYWNRPDETARVMLPDGFLRSGDIGALDERGYLRLLDRKKDMVNVSGFNVYPNEVEEVLCAHPGIAEAAVIGVDDENTGEAPAAFIVRRDAGLTRAAVLAHCRANLTAYKCPRVIEFRDALPKSPVGKILRRELREQWRAAHPARADTV